MGLDGLGWGSRRAVTINEGAAQWCSTAQCGPPPRPTRPLAPCPHRRVSAHRRSGRWVTRVRDTDAGADRRPRDRRAATPRPSSSRRGARALTQAASLTAATPPPARPPTPRDGGGRRPRERLWCRRGPGGAPPSPVKVCLGNPRGPAARRARVFPWSRDRGAGAPCFQNDRQRGARGDRASLPSGGCRSRRRPAGRAARATRWKSARSSVPRGGARAPRRASVVGGR